MKASRVMHDQLVKPSHAFAGLLVLTQLQHGSIEQMHKEQGREAARSRSEKNYQWQ
jgi:hypothetical protein